LALTTIQHGKPTQLPLGGYRELCTIEETASEHTIANFYKMHGSYSEYGTDTLISLHWLHIPEHNLFKIAVMTYQALNGSAPAYLSLYFTGVADVPSPQRLRSTSTNQPAVPLFNLSTVGKRAFPVSGANFWNSLPLHDICTVACDIQSVPSNISLSLVISGLNFLICLLLHCRPCNNFVI